MKRLPHKPRRYDVLAEERHDRSASPHAERVQVLYEHWMQAEQRLTQTLEKARTEAQKAVQVAYEAYHRASRGTAAVYAISA